jgi:hypothetical protein
MDKTIHKHLDRRDALLDKVKAEMQGAQVDIDLELVLEDPESALQLFAEDLANEMLGRYARIFVEEGRTFARDVMAKRTPIVVDKGNDPNANKI